ncbi:MAG: ArsR/SmtB family transcription factor [Pelotomaculum sp.]
MIKVNSKGGWEINNGNNLKPALPSGDELLQMMEALANPHRLQIIALLTGRRVHVSQLAREARISRPLLYMHLKRLETAGLVTSRMELSEDGKAMNFFEVTPFVLYLDPERIKEAAKTLTIKKSGSSAPDAINKEGDNNK